jgi:hypothetical protein
LPLRRLRQASRVSLRPIGSSVANNSF